MAISSREFPPGAIAKGRVANRLSIGFVLDLVALTRAQRHLVDTLLLTSIVQANVALISRQADLQVAYAALDAPPPDELRRPVSVNALASSLRLPFETVRRRVRNLAAEGLCRLVNGGVIVPQSVLSSPTYLSNAFAGYERLRAFYYELRDAGLLPPLPASNVVFATGQVPVRAVARLASDYVLRVIELMMEALDDLVGAVLIFEVFRGNVEHLSPEVRGREGLAPGDFVPDRLRRPIRVSAVAERVGLPAETARRHVAELVRRGIVSKVRGGLLLPSETLARPEIVGFMAENLTNLHRMFSGLSQLGVLAIWDGLQPPAADPQKIPQNG